MFQGTRAVVSGGTRGIGRAIAEGFLKSGASHVVLLGRSVEGIQTAQKWSEQYAAEVEFIPMDVSEVSQIESVAKTLSQKPIHHLVNAAGVTSDLLLLRTSDEEMYRVIQVNLMGAMQLTRALLKPLMKAQGSSVVNVSSVVAIKGNKGQSVYAASKAGLLGFTKSLSKEVAAKQVRVNALVPGFIDTQMTQMLSEELKMQYCKDIPLQRFGSVDEMAHAALFLASAKYMTGQVNLV